MAPSRPFLERKTVQRGVFDAINLLAEPVASAIDIRTTVTARVLR
jgi:hypothetical protein